jgi:D-mannonate dehydratase
LQHALNEQMAKSENLDRELNTQKEIMKQNETTRKEYIEKLKKELNSIERKHAQILDENCMTAEDYRSTALDYFAKNLTMSKTIEKLSADTKIMTLQLIEAEGAVREQTKQLCGSQMESEDHLSRLVEQQAVEQQLQKEIEDAYGLVHERQQELDAVK